MRQTLLRIPLDGPWTMGRLELPGFGFGIVLVAWCLVGIVWLYRNPAKRAHLQALFAPLGIWLAIAAAIVMVPWFVERPRATKLPKPIACSRPIPVRSKP